MGRLMRVAVTGPMSKVGKAIVKELVGRGHHVRAFGVPQGEDPFPDLDVQYHPGSVQVGGSIEPVLSERQALVHAACMDDPGKDKKQHAVHIEQGTLYARYGAEREQVDHFIHVTPKDPDRRYETVLRQAIAHVQDTRGIMNVRIVQADEPTETAKEVVDLLEEMPMLGAIEGDENAVTL